MSFGHLHLTVQCSVMTLPYSTLVASVTVLVNQSQEGVALQIKVTKSCVLLFQIMTQTHTKTEAAYLHVIL